MTTPSTESQAAKVKTTMLVSRSDVMIISFQENKNLISTLFIPGFLVGVVHQSVPSLTIPPRRPPGIHTFSPHGGVWFSPNFLCPGGRGFELEKFSTVLKEKCRNFSICFRESGGSLKSRCSCAVLYQFLQKQ